MSIVNDIVKYIYKRRRIGICREFESEAPTAGNMRMPGLIYTARRDMSVSCHCVSNMGLFKHARTRHVTRTCSQHVTRCRLAVC